jgi:hypothetical protein
MTGAPRICGACGNLRDGARAIIRAADVRHGGQSNMRVSPSIDVNRNDFDRTDGNALAYAAALLKGTLPTWPQAVLKLAGRDMVARAAQDRLEQVHGVPRGKAQVEPIFGAENPDSISVSIEYFPARPGMRKVWVEFKLDLESLPIKVDFEVSPDGAFVEEAKVDFDRLKTTIKKHAFGGRVQNIKIATKPGGIASFERPTSDKVKAALKAKIKAALSADVRLPGMRKPVNVELYGSIFSKFQDDGVIKNGGEAGLMLTVPFDFL